MLAVPQSIGGTSILSVLFKLLAPNTGGVLYLSGNESMVSFVSRRYMRGENGSLVVCLSQYLHLRNLYSVYAQSHLSSVVFRTPALWSVLYNPIQK